jgi:hypothetical protein
MGLPMVELRFSRFLRWLHGPSPSSLGPTRAHFSLGQRTRGPAPERAIRVVGLALFPFEIPCQNGLRSDKKPHIRLEFLII